MKDMKDISASAQEALEHARDKAFGKVKAGVRWIVVRTTRSSCLVWNFGQVGNFHNFLYP